MRTHLKGLAALALLTFTASALPGVAVAHDGGGYGYHDHRGPERYGPANLTVRNDFDGRLDLFVDGRFVQTVPGNSTVNLPFRPGFRDVTLRRAETGFVVARSQVNLAPGRNQFLPVAAPMGQMTVHNTGAVPMRVQVDGQYVSVMPGQRAQVTTATGNVRLVGSISALRGDWVTLDQTVWLEPGQVGYQALRADPAVLVVANPERFPVRVMVDGFDAGFLNPGETRRVFVAPGTVQVQFLDRYGRPRSSSSVVVTRGREQYARCGGSPQAGGYAGVEYGYRGGRDDDDHRGGWDDDDDDDHHDRDWDDDRRGPGSH
jgi:hypothetical protein